MACKYKYNNQWYSKEELQNILYKERGIDKYGKLVKPEINVKNREGFKVYFTDAYGNSAFSNSNFNTREEAQAFIDEKKDTDISFKIVPNKGIQPKITNETLKESIDSVKNNLGVFEQPNDLEIEPYGEEYSILFKGELNKFDTYEKAVEWINNKFPKNKEYTEQALINTKIAKLKEVAKKYPRSLIRSEVKRINTSSSQELYDQFGADELPFQKVSKDTQDLFDKIMNTPSRVIDEKIKNCL